MVVAQAPAKEDVKVTENNSLQLTRNLLRIAVFHISYIRGLFPEEYFQDMTVQSLNNMKVKKLLPLDLESRRLIEWMEKGVYDALRNKYLKTMNFSLIEGESGPVVEEYSFSFDYSTVPEDVVSLHVSKNGRNKRVLKTNSGPSEMDHEHMRKSACKMMRTLITLMQTLDAVPDERTIVVKLYYYDDITPSDYEPPFFRCCTFDQKRTWRQFPFQMKAGEVNSKYIAFSLKVKSTLDSCGDEIEQNSNILVEHDPQRSTGASDDQLSLSEMAKSAELPNENMEDEAEITQDAVCEESNHDQIKGWLLSRKASVFHVTDLMADFPNISLQLMEELLSRMVKDGALSYLGNDNYETRDSSQDDYYEVEKADRTADHLMSEKDHAETDQERFKQEDPMYLKALYYALPLEYITITDLQAKLGKGVNQLSTRKLIEKMVSEGYVEGMAVNRKMGRRVIHSEQAQRKFQEVKEVLDASKLFNQCVKKANNLEHALVQEISVTDVNQDGLKQQEKSQKRTTAKKSDKLEMSTAATFPSLATEEFDGSTCGALHSFGSDITHHGIAKPRNNASFSDERASPGPKLNKRTMSRESRLKSSTPISSPPTLGDRGFEFQDSQDKGVLRKASMVEEPIYQTGKRLRLRH